MEMNMQMASFWDVALYSLVVKNISEEFTASIIHLIMQVVTSSEMSASTKTTRCYILEDSHLQIKLF
jgi:hypothetical protein